MLVFAFHLVLTLALLWQQRRTNYRYAPWKIALVWYAAGASFIAVESYAVTRLAFSVLTLQGILLDVLFAAAAFFAFRHAQRARKGLFKPFLIFLGYGLVGVLLGGFLLAQTEIVRGLSSGL